MALVVRHSRSGCSIGPLNLHTSMARLSFFVLAAVFCIAACLPLKSKTSESWADLTLGIGCEDYGSGIWYDRQFDFPTGSLFIDVPAWAVDTCLFVGAAIAFGFEAKRRLSGQRG